MVEDIIERLRSMDKEIQDLKYGKSNTEAWLAAIVRKYGEIDISFNDIYSSDSKKVKVKNNIQEDSSKLTIYYESE
jgi:hypothetical protein